MNKQVIANEIIKWVSDVRETVVEQAPLLAHEVVNFGLAKYFLLSLVALCFTVTLVCYSCTWWRRARSSDDGPDVGIAIVVTTAAFWCGVLLLAWTLRLLMLLTAPRLYVLQELARLAQ